MNPNPIFHNNIIQGSDEWHQLRCGVLTASVMKNLLTPKFQRAKNDKMRDLVFEMAAQRVTGNVEEIPTNYHMQRGHEEEIYARDLYNETTGNNAIETGFVTSDELGFKIGYSPDGVVGDDGLIEIKSRTQKNQFKTILSNITPAEYQIQIQAGMLITGREWCDFISYSNGMQMFVQRNFRDDMLIQLLREVIIEFEGNVLEMVQTFQNNAAPFAMAERRYPELETTITESI